MRYETEVDISRLGRDASDLEGKAADFRNEFERLLASINELNSTWSGIAKNEFDTQVQLEAQECREGIDHLDSVIDGMHDAKQEYTKCESTVESLINRIRV